MLKYLKLYYVLVALPYILLLAGAALFFEPLKNTILNNPIPHLNYAIIAIVLVGGIFILNNARRLIRQAGMLQEFSAALHAKTDSTTLREKANRYVGALACILQMIATSTDRSISHQEQAALEHELTNARSRLVRRNALPQYLTGLLVAMGLLGTFIGLLATLADISVLIGSFADIDMDNIEPIQVFRVMIERMKAPMASMGIAFSTSMFGLLGSIVIGLMMLGIRRLQGDIISLLNSEVARHIEVALSFESISFSGGNTSIGCYEEATDLTSKVLLRIEERLAEAARVRQRALSAEIDDFKKQRAEMLQVLTEQTTASNSFRTELQHLGSQLGSIFDSMEKRNSEISGQISDLTVQLAGDARETHKLLATQVDEQKGLRNALDSYNIEEWLAETARMQQRALSAEMEEFKQQRGEMLQVLSEQTAASNNFSTELVQVGSQLRDIFDSMESSTSEISSQISELTVHLGSEAKESQRLLNVTSNNLRSTLQQLGSQLDTHLNAISKGMERGNGEIVHQVQELMTQAAAASSGNQERLNSISEGFRSDLHQLAEQLGTLCDTTEKSSQGVGARVSELMAQMTEEAKTSRQQLTVIREDLGKEMQKLDGRLGEISGVSEKGDQEIASRLIELTSHMDAAVKATHERLDLVGNDLRNELQQHSIQLGTISKLTEKGTGEITAQISEILFHMAPEPEEPEKILVNADE